MPLLVFEFVPPPPPSLGRLCDCCFPEEEKGREDCSVSPFEGGFGEGAFACKEDEDVALLAPVPLFPAEGFGSLSSASVRRFLLLPFSLPPVVVVFEDASVLFRSADGFDEVCCFFFSSSRGRFFPSGPSPPLPPEGVAAEEETFWALEDDAVLVRDDVCFNGVGNLFCDDDDDACPLGPQEDGAR